MQGLVTILDVVVGIFEAALRYEACSPFEIRSINSGLDCFALFRAFGIVLPSWEHQDQGINDPVCRPHIS